MTLPTLRQGLADPAFELNVAPALDRELGLVRWPLFGRYLAGPSRRERRMC